MWTAISLWVVSAAAIAIYAAVAARYEMAGSGLLLWIAALPLLYFGAIFLLCASYFTISWIWRARRPAGVRLGVRGTWRLWWREYATLAGSPPRLMLYGLLLRDPPSARVDTPVLLVHGVLCNAGVWVRLARYLRSNGVRGLYSLSYGPPLASIDAFADQVAGKIRAILGATGARRVTIVAHSMGGLVVRAYLQKHGAATVTRVVTIGSPHHGSVLAWFFPGTSMAQMRPGNAWLAALNRQRLDPGMRLVSLWSWHDSMVAPQTSSELPGAVDVTLAGIGHNALLGEPEVLAYALAEIEAAKATPDTCSVSRMLPSDTDSSAR
jgi:triacylglycerol esterase/lipase EstA (alpha/beta hydrolase family)